MQQHDSITGNESSNHFEAIFNYATTGIIIVNFKGIITAANPFALKEFDYTEDQLIGNSINLLIPSRYHTTHKVYHHVYFKNPKSRPMGIGQELFAVKRDGTEFPAEISLSYFHYKKEQFVITFINNISVRKKAEVEIIKLNNELEAKVAHRTKDLKNALQQLEISKSKLEEVLLYQKALIDNAGALIIATDEKGIIKLFNPEAALALEYNEEEIVGKTTPVLLHDKNDIIRKRKELFNEFGITITDGFQVLVEKSRRNTHEEEQYTYVKKNGASFPVSLTITAIRDSSGTISGFMGIAIDISERKKAESNLQKALEKEKELGELKSRFVSMASHEFRTPLSTVLSSAYLIEKYATAEEQPKREKHLQRIISSVNMLTDILNDFLSLGKIEEGKIQVRLSEFNISDQVTAITEEIKSILKKEQEIRYQHKGNTTMLLDLSLLKHIILNLVSNAIKFSPENSLIEIKTINTNGCFTLSVKDHGMGISREDQQHLMERFFRGANAGNIQGTGLGLHIVSKYAELMNGTVECKSELEQGTEFIITFNTQTLV